MSTRPRVLDIPGIMMFTTETQLPTVNTLLHDWEDIWYFCYQFTVIHDRYSCLQRDWLEVWYWRPTSVCVWAGSYFSVFLYLESNDLTWNMWMIVNNFLQYKAKIKLLRKILEILKIRCFSAPIFFYLNNILIVHLTKYYW